MRTYADIDTCSHVLHDLRGGCSGCNCDVESIVGDLERQLAERDERIRRLTIALEHAREHLLELREAWERGVMREGDNLGGSRSNRNVHVLVEIRAALAELAE